MILMMSFVGWKVWGFPGAVASALAIARSFNLSNKIDQQQIGAQLDDGVLTLTLKKSKEALPRRIAVG
jgi:HSP20 family molecular chaperone IbpA